MKTQRTSNSQSNSEQKAQCCRYQDSGLQTILQSHYNKNSMIPAQKEARRPRITIENPDINPQSYS
jgi:hypothetical protein